MEEDKNKFIAGKLEQVENYKAYIPNFINHEFSFKDNKTLKLLEDATIALCTLNSKYLDVDFVNSFTSMLVRLEAYSSNAIEGTKVDVKDFLNTDSTADENIDIKKIKNLYYTTYDYYKNSIKKETDFFTIKEIEKINKLLFKNIKLENSTPGKIRDVQNYIGGTNILDAFFVPPPPKLVKDLLNDLNDFWKNPSLYIPNLIKIALYHFQFETIHPFCDGNGRTGRLLINIQLRQTKLLDLPVLCLSEYWSRNKGLYYDALTTARYTNDIEYWIRFFLQSIITTSYERIETIIMILKIKEKYSTEIKIKFKSSDNHLKLLDYLISQSPFINVKDAENILKITYQGANKIIDNFVSLGILKEYNENKRNRIFFFEEYFKLIFNKKFN